MRTDADRLQGIETFVSAVEAGSFALAATRLGRTRSAVAKAVARLESRLGVRLFQRTTRSQRLTDDGQAYYERCRRALAELDAADAALEAGRHAPTGTLRATMPALVGRVCLAPALLALARDHPQLTLDLHFSDRRVDLVDDGFDLAVRSGVLDDSTTLAARLLGWQWMGVYAAPAYLSARGRPADFTGLLEPRGGHAFVGYARDGQLQPWRFHHGTEERLQAVQVPAHLCCDSLEVLAAAAAEGLGVGRLPHWLAAPLVAAGRLERVFDEPKPFGFALHALWPRDRALPLRTRVAVDALAVAVPSLLTP